MPIVIKIPTPWHILLVTGPKPESNRFFFYNYVSTIKSYHHVSACFLLLVVAKIYQEWERELSELKWWSLLLRYYSDLFFGHLLFTTHRAALRASCMYVLSMRRWRWKLWEDDAEYHQAMTGARWADSCIFQFIYIKQNVIFRMTQSAPASHLPAANAQEPCHALAPSCY